MPINSSIFIGYLIICVGLYWALPKPWRPFLLVVCGLIYYAYYSFINLFILLLITVFTISISRFLLTNKKKSIFVIGLSFVILLLVLYKYTNASIQIFSKYASSPLDISEIILPLGISYLIFECIHLLIISYRREIAHLSWLDALSFLWFFPARSAGPIKRFPAFLESLTNSINPKYFVFGVLFIVIGFFQKIVIADSIAGSTSALNNVESIVSSFDIAILLCLYSVRIYADFSGLSHIAIGASLLFGITVPKNFSYPYFRSNIAEFWRCWHMSLSSFVRDYIYFPLGGSRVSLLQLSFNLMVVMFVVGIWHGSTLNFAVWGLYHGFGLVLHRLWAMKVGNYLPNGNIRYVLGMTITFIFVTIGWVFFATSSLSDSLYLISVLFGYA